ncbi:hypothetical protein D7V97_22745 [Corallococcus sp. CA053C]|nr:hypothetical protein D7V97_22745 [Corallococcus sp. CA053C]
MSMRSGNELSRLAKAVLNSMHTLIPRGLFRAVAAGTSARLLLIFLALGAAASDADDTPLNQVDPSATCETCCPRPPCSTPPPPMACTFTSGLNNGCSGMRYADEQGVYGPCEVTSTSKRACSCGATGAGTQMCLGNGSFGVCRSSQSPTPEMCNSCDDDLDGIVDNIAPQGCSTNKPGACSTGRLACTSGAYVCQQIIFPSLETCDGLDSDCDGVRDEDEFGRTSCGVGDCYTSKYACQGGAWQTCVPLPSSPEVCDGRDNDCDSVTDEGLGTLSCGQGQCAASVPACRDGHPQACIPLIPEPERCDGRDNDCDLDVDEGDVCRFDNMSCECTPIPQAEACANTTCGVAPDGCGGNYSCGSCLML